MEDSSENDLTTLLTQLCSCFVGRDRRAYFTQPTRTRTERIRTLRIKANNVLFQQMKGPHFVRGLCKVKKKGRLSLSEVDKINWYIYKLRCNHRYDDANRFDGLMKSLQKKDGSYDEKTRIILQFLVCLANFDEVKEGKHVGEELWHQVPDVVAKNDTSRIYPEGPPLYGDSKSRIYTGFHYMQYPSHIFDCTPMKYDSYTRKGKDGISTKMFSLEPGDGLHGNGWFIQKEPGAEYERNIQGSLFGALVHSRISPEFSMYTKLNIPDLREDQPRELTIPKLHEISEDEGFAGSLSHSASKDHIFSFEVPSEHTEDDMWDFALKAKPRKHYVWEQVGRKGYTVKERPYLTESTLKAVDEVYKLELELLALVDPTIIVPELREVTMRHLVHDVVNLLIGVPSDTFIFNKDEYRFTMDPGTYISGRSPEALQSLCASFIECGTNYQRVYTFSTPPILDSIYKAGLVFQAFTSTVRKYLQHYKGYLLRVSKDKTLMQINFMLNRIMRQMRFLAALCKCEASSPWRGSVPRKFPTGVGLLSYLYQEALDASSSPNYLMLLSMLHSACVPYLMFIQDWVFEGICKDAYNEFMIQINSDFLRFRDKHYWTSGYAVLTRNTNDAVPIFLKDFAESVFVCGKSINLLKLIAPQHFLFRVDQHVPRVTVTFSESELRTIERTCQVYLSRMNELTRQHTMTREKLSAMEEVKKQDLLVRARKQAIQEMEKYYERTQAVRKAVDEKKRKEFKELKEQMQEDLQRRASDKEKEKEADRERMEKLTKQELLEGQIEADLESKVRQEVVDYYEGLMKEATVREQLALWRVRRLELETKRLQFFKEQEEALEAELSENPLVPKVPNVSVQNPSDSSLDDTDAKPGEVPNWAKRTGQDGPIEVKEDTEFKPFDEELPKWAITGVKSPPQEIGFDVYSPGKIPEWAKKGLEKSGDCPVLVDEPDGAKGDAKLASSVKQTGSHVSGETTESESRPNIKMTEDRHANMESSEDTVTKATIKPVGDKHVSMQSEENTDSRTHIRVSEHMHASKETVEAVEKRHLRMVDNRHANVQSEGAEEGLQVQRLKRFQDKHAGQQTEADEWMIRVRNKHGHASDTTVAQTGVNVPRLKKHETRNVFTESVEELRNYQVKRCKKSVSGQSVDQQSEALDIQARPHIKLNLEQHASRESEYVDEDLLRVERFQLRNKKGHSSDSTVQRLLYGESFGTARKLSDSSLAGSVFPEEEMMFASDVLLEPFKDKYDMLERPPMPDLLSNVVLDTYSGYSDALASVSDDVKAHRFLPLSALLKKSVSVPLLAQIGLVNRCLVDWFIGELKIRQLFFELRSFLFMQDGEFGQSVSDQLFEKLATNPKPHQMLNPVFLNGVLAKAIQYSSSSEVKDTSSSNLSFVLKHMPPLLQPNTVSALDCLELTYRVEWPLNIVVTDTCLVKYGQIFTFMLQLKRVVWTLKDVWHRLKRDAVLNNGSNATQFRQLQLYRQEMQHFVKVMQGYLANQIIDVTWREFLDDIDHKVETLDDLHSCHAEYLNKCILRCLLNKKAKPVMKVITDIFGLILKFRNRLVSQSWSRDSPAAEVQHPGFLDMCATYSSFQEYSVFLFRVVRKLTLRGYQSHLQELLLRLDFNEYYSQTL